MNLLNSEININKLVLGILVQSGTGAAVHKNRPSHGLALNTAGTKRYIFNDGTVIDVDNNEIIFLPKYSSYEVKIITDGDCYAINFDFEPDGVFKPEKFSANKARLFTLFKTAAEAWIKKSVGYDLKIKCILYDILYELKMQTLGNFESKNGLSIAAATEYMELHYTDPDLTVPQLANMCNISDTYFRKLFFEQYNSTPIKYINRKKLMLAEDLLCSGGYSIKDVQQLCGFRDACRFSREFKKFSGVSPTAYMLNK